MNDQAAAMGFEEQVPTNPYRVQDVADGRGGGPYHPNAPGLTGEMLDAVLKTAFTEGSNRGRSEGVQIAQARFAAIWDEGLSAGVAATSQVGAERQQVASDRLLEIVAERCAQVEADLSEISEGLLNLPSAAGDRATKDRARKLQKKLASAMRDLVRVPRAVHAAAAEADAEEAAAG